MMKAKRLFLTLLCLCLSGCAPVAFLVGAAAGISGYKYYEGALIVVYHAPYERTWDATLGALKEMGFEIEEKERELSKSRIKARPANDKPVTLNIKYISSDETEVTIRVGIMGDKKASEVIKENIRKKLFK